MEKIMLIYPPGRSFQRGEERCQIDIDSSAANTHRPCNDLGYMAAILKELNYSVFLRDYQGENALLKDLLEDINKESPNLIILSITNGSILDDLKIVKKIKETKPDITVVLKGALFFNPEERLFSELDYLENVDYLIGGEPEFIIGPLVNAHYNDKTLLKNIQGISYKENGKWVSNYLKDFCEDLDGLPFPDRSLMKNELYINPETNRPMANITTAKGCCFSCKYCLSFVISGKKVRERSTNSIFEEIKECFFKYGIKDFFFRSDTFTVNKQKVIDLCNLIINSELNGKINWVATTRVDTIDEEMLKLMKKSGCSLLSIGFESGSDESLKRMKKNTSTWQNLKIAKLCKKYGIKILGHFLVGFDWEDESHLDLTKKHIFDIDADYIEVSVVTPYYRTEIYEELIQSKNIMPDILGFDSYGHVLNHYSKLSADTLQHYRKQVLREFYLRPKYIIRCLMRIKSLSVLKNYIHYGMKMIRNTLF